MSVIGGWDREKVQRHFDARIDKSGDCWVWTGPLNRYGYGIFNFGARGRKLAHRVSYELAFGPMPDGLVGDHTCHNEDEACFGGNSCPHRKCCNPEHLEPVPIGENSKRGNTPPALNLAKKLCSRGHEFDYTDKRGWRKCSTCQREVYGMRKERNPRFSVKGEDGRNRWTSHCSRGHEWRDETTRWSNGKRYCKTCDRTNLRNTRERRKNDVKNDRKGI